MRNHMAELLPGWASTSQRSPLTLFSACGSMRVSSMESPSSTPVGRALASVRSGRSSKGWRRAAP